MPQQDDRPIHTIDNLWSGRNGADPPHSLSPAQCVDAFNVDWYLTSLCRKRGGMTSEGVSGGSVFGSPIYWLSRYVPGADEANAILLGAGSTATPVWKYLQAGTSWADLTVGDAGNSSNMMLNSGVTLNGKHFIAYDSAVDRLHVLRSGTTTIDRTGLAQPTAAPTTGALLAGAVTATRTYKVAWVVRSGGIVIRRSELSAATGPIVMVAQQVPITKPTAPGEGETDWELYAAGTDGVYWKIATTAIGTATVNDNNANISTVTGALAPQVGINTVFPSVKYLATDGNRLFGAGSWEGRQNSRVWFTPVLGDNDIGDDERIVDSTSRKTYLDLNENDGGYITGISQAIQGAIYVFKFRQIWKLSPTGDFQTPYIPYRVTSNIGCVSHRTIHVGEDEDGNPCVYFASHIGPSRVGDRGVEYLGADLEDQWTTLNINQADRTFYAIYYPDKSQYWLWVAGPTNVTDRVLVYDRRRGQTVKQGLVRGGWTIYDGLISTGFCACLFANTLGASMSKDLKPYLGGLSATTLYKADTTATSDAGTAYRGYIKTRTLRLGGEGSFCTVSEPELGGEVSTGVTITVTVIRDLGAESKSGTVSLTALSTETRVARIAEGCRLAKCKVVQYEIGDATATATAQWKLDKIVIPYDIDDQVP